MASVLEMLGRWWVVIVGCVGRSTETSPSDLPLSKLESASRRDPPKTSALNTGKKPRDPEALKVQREQFLRHPSLNSRDGDESQHQGNAHGSTASSRKEKKRKPGPEVAPALRIQDWSSPAPTENRRPPPRPPRPPSSVPPAVIITPCTPTGTGQPEYVLTSKASPLDRTIAAYKSAQNSTLDHAQVTNKRPVYSRKPEADPPTEERDIAEVKLNSKGDNRSRSQAPVRAAANESIRRSFRIPESLKRVLFEPLSRKSNSMSGVLSEPPPWISRGSTGNSSTTKASEAEYVTSTPVKAQRVAEKVGRQDSSSSETSRTDSGGTPHSLRLPEEQPDLLPYPDVFDLDLYYGMRSGRYSVSTKDRSSSIVRCSLGEKNPFLPACSPSTLTAAGYTLEKSSRRFGFVPDASSLAQNKEATSVAVGRATKRERDDRRPPNYSRPSPRGASRAGKENAGSDFPLFKPDATSTSGSSSSASDSDSHERVLMPITLRELTQSVKAQAHGQRPTPARTRSTRFKADFDTPSPLPGPGPSKIRHPPAYPPPPIVIVSHHRFGSADDSLHSAFSTSNESSGASDLALRTRSRLEEARRRYGKSGSAWTDDSSSSDPISPI